MTHVPTPLPEYDAPPVSEVALAVDFAPLENWRGPHAGRYWSLIDGEYPNTQVHPPIPSQIEKFGEEHLPQPPIQIFATNADESRSWFISQTGNYLIQVQRDKFIVNWRKVEGDDIYPRYQQELRKRFEREWRTFKAFVEERALGAFVIRQCEVTYINDLVKGADWNTFAQSLTLFAQQLGKGSDGFLPPPETLSISGTFLMQNDQGRLHFHIQHLLRQIDLKEVVQLSLAARGRPESDSDSDVLRWMDFGREWIVRGFTDLTSERAHRLWKRTR